MMKSISRPVLPLAVLRMRTFGLALLIAMGALCAVQLNSPPTLVTADPQETMLSPMNMGIPADLPLNIYDAI